MIFYLLKRIAIDLKIHKISILDHDYRLYLCAYGHGINHLDTKDRLFIGKLRETLGLWRGSQVIRPGLAVLQI